MNRRVVLILILVLSVLIYNIFKCKSKDIELANYYTSDIEGLRIIKNVDSLSLVSLKKKYLKNIIVTDVNNRTYYLNELLKGDDAKIVLKFSEVQCSSCIKHAIDYVKKYEKKIGNDNIILIGEFMNFNSFSNFSRLNPQTIVYNSNRINFSLVVDQLDFPYYIVTDSSLYIKDIFVTLKELPQRSDDYLIKLKQ